MMKRLDVLKAEKEAVANMRCMPFSSKALLAQWYQKEIEAIEIYGAENPEIE